MNQHFLFMLLLDLLVYMKLVPNILQLPSFVKRLGHAVHIHHFQLPDLNTAHIM